MNWDENYFHSPPNAQAQAMPKQTYNPSTQAFNNMNQLPSAPAQYNLYQAPVGAGNRVAPMSIAAPQRYVVPQAATKATSSSKLSPCAIVGIVTVTLVVLTGIGIGIAVGVINASDTYPYCAFTCNSGSCILPSQVCDGHNDCSNGEDENNCGGTSCIGYQCTSGTGCISSSAVCDGIADCFDGDDELNCTSTTTGHLPSTECLTSQFTCVNGGTYGSCIPSSWECDNINDCYGNTDEINCATTSCSANQFHCSTGSLPWYGGSCILSSYQCDGFSHCHGGEDEVNCTATACSTQQFTCVNGGMHGNCIPSHWKCDNINDCNGNTDEQNCGTTVVTTVPDKYQCPDDTTNTEILKSKVCDGTLDCPGGADEDRCIIKPNGNNNGKVQIYSAATSTYRQICATGWTTSHSDALCAHLGYSSSASTVQETTTEDGLQNTWTTFDISMLSQATPAQCTSYMIVKIVCVQTAATTCGSSSRIVGGEDADIDQYPWQVSLQHAGNHFSGGTIISDRWVIAAAHSVKNIKSLSNYRVVAGITNISSTLLPNNEYSISKVVSHPLYTRFPIHMDLALIYVSTDFVFSNTIQPACLPATGQLFPDLADAHITGWGKTSEGGSSSDTLQTVIVPYYNTESCKTTFPLIAHNVFVGNVCAGVPKDGGKDSCQGDSGGPVIIRFEGRDYVVGATSWGYGCARPDYPGVYAEISYFIDWINREKAKV